MPEGPPLLGTVVSVPGLPRLDAPPAGKGRKFRSLVTCPQGSTCLSFRCPGALTCVLWQEV